MRRRRRFYVRRVLACRSICQDCARWLRVPPRASAAGPRPYVEVGHGDPIEFGKERGGIWDYRAAVLDSRREWRDVPLIIRNLAELLHFN